jgi:hypothetical protein
MAISNADIAALPTYTDAELLILYRWALANGAAGTTRAINGRSVTFASVDELRKSIEWLESRVNSSSNDGMALITFDEPA